MGNLILLVFCFGAGIVLRNAGRFPENTSAALNAFIINISLPAMALAYLSRVEMGPALAYAALMPWIMFVIGAGLLWLLCRLFELPRHITGCVILVGALSNTSFVGIPMIEAYFGPEWMSVGIVADQLGSFMVLSMLGVTIARLFAASHRPTVREIAGRILQFPPFIATVLAIMLLPFSYPEWLDTMLMRLAATVAPLALVSVGYQLRLSAFRGRALPLALALGYNLVLGPLIIMALYWYGFGASGTLVDVVIFEAAMSPMISAAIVAMDNDLDPSLATLAVGVGVPLSFITLTAWYALLVGF